MIGSVTKNGGREEKWKLMIGSVTKNGGRREVETYESVTKNGGRREMETYDRICDQKRGEKRNGNL